MEDEMGTSPHIVWTKKERQDVANKMFEFLRKGLDKKDSLREAQKEALQPHRHRNWPPGTTSIHAELHKIEPYLDIAREKYRPEEKEEVAPAASDTEAATALRHEEADEVDTEAIQWAEERAQQQEQLKREAAMWQRLPGSGTPAPVLPVKDLFAKFIGDVMGHPTVQAAMSRLIDRTVTEVLEEWTNPKPKPAEVTDLPIPAATPPPKQSFQVALDKLKHVPQAEQQARARKPVVVIAGLLPDQEAAFNRKYAEVIKLRYWKDKKLVNLDEKAREADFVLFAHFVSHEATSHVKALTKSRPNLTYSIVHGGSTEMQRELDTWLSKHA
jgi:hypothetical protein